MRIRKVKGFIKGKFLDIGCERGDLAAHFHGFGLDRNPKGPKGRAVQFTIKDSHLPYRSDSFDTVTMIALIEHMDNIDFNLREIHRILNSKGQLIITTPSPKAKKMIKLLSFFPFILDPSGIDHKSYFSKEDLSRLFGDNGFEIVCYKTFQFGMNQIMVARKADV